MGRKIDINPSVRAKVELAIAGNRPVIKSDSKKKRTETRQALWAIIRDELKEAAANTKLELSVIRRRATAILEASGDLHAKQWFNNIMHNGRLPSRVEVSALARTLGIEESVIDAHLRLAPWIIDMMPKPSEGLHEDKAFNSAAENQPKMAKREYLRSASDLKRDLKEPRYLQPSERPLVNRELLICSDAVKPPKQRDRLVSLGAPEPLENKERLDFSSSEQPSHIPENSAPENNQKPKRERVSTAEEVAAIVSDFLQFGLEGQSLRKKAFDMHTAAKVVDLLATREEEWNKIDQA